MLKTLGNLLLIGPRGPEAKLIRKRRRGGSSEEEEEEEEEELLPLPRAKSNGKQISQFTLAPEQIAKMEQASLYQLECKEENNEGTIFMSCEFRRAPDQQPVQPVPLVLPPRMAQQAFFAPSAPPQETDMLQHPAPQRPRPPVPASPPPPVKLQRPAEPDLCACGKDLAACGACGHGWAQQQVDPLPSGPEQPAGRSRRQVFEGTPDPNGNSFQFNNEEFGLGNQATAPAVHPVHPVLPGPDQRLPGRWRMMESIQEEPCQSAAAGSGDPIHEVHLAAVAGLPIHVKGSEQPTTCLRVAHGDWNVQLLQFGRKEFFLQDFNDKAGLSWIMYGFDPTTGKYYPTHDFGHIKGAYRPEDIRKAGVLVDQIAQALGQGRERVSSTCSPCVGKLLLGVDCLIIGEQSMSNWGIV